MTLTEQLERIKTDYPEAWEFLHEEDLGLPKYDDDDELIVEKKEDDNEGIY